ncbi:MAG: vWA domain-containing protein [Pseudonocardiaceae bacterium]
MSEIRGQLLPVYVMADESMSMSNYVGELNAGLTSLHEALIAESMAAAKVRFSVLGFSDDVVVRLHLSDLRRERQLPELFSRGTTNYAAAFDALLYHIPQDVESLKRDQFQVHRPAVFFLSDGQPSDGGSWLEPHRRLTDRSINPAAPNIIACGIGEAEPSTILGVATHQDFAFVTIEGTQIGSAIAKFCTALTKSIVASGQSLTTDSPTLVVDKPEGFRMAIDVI